MEPPSTLENTRNWKTWHGFNYFFGGSTFFLGSIILFPFFGDFMDTATISGWLYTLGSATFLVADITEWIHFTTLNCKFLSFSINFFISVSGSLLYLIGSICFIPSVNKSAEGEEFFIIGSALIVISQGWKGLRVLTQRGKSVHDAIMEDESGFYVDMFAGAGGLMYLIGTILLEMSVKQPDLSIAGITSYSLGGACFLASALFMQKRYFFDYPSNYFVAGV